MDSGWDGLGSVDGVEHALQIQGVGGDDVLGQGGRGVVDTGLSWDDEVVRNFWFSRTDLARGEWDEGVLFGGFGMI
jgi:hypothetical protein